MLIDRTHRAWMAVTAVLLALSTAAYLAYANTWPDGPRGGSLPGMIFGLAGSALMIFAGLLSARKRLPQRRLGTAQAWLKGHIWFGLLSGPLIFFHAGFRWGGLLEQIVMGLVVVILVSGILGLVLQQMLPRVITGAAPAEAMFDQLPHVCSALRSSADDLVTQLCGPATVLEPSLGSDAAGTLVASFYRETVRPFLDIEAPAASPLVEPVSLATTFRQVRDRVPAAMHVALDQLQRLCEERRQLLLQAKLHHWLHAWLLVHIPLSAALLVLGVAHAVVACLY